MDDLKEGSRADQGNSIARAGGLARARTLTKEERSASASKAAQARWSRRDGIDRVFVTDLAPAVPNNEQEYVTADPDFNARVARHKEDPTCPCDECVSKVLRALQDRYLEILRKFDARMKLSKEEEVLFQIMTGAKANAHTRAYREACKRLSKP